MHLSRSSLPSFGFLLTPFLHGLALVPLMFAGGAWGQSHYWDTNGTSAGSGSATGTWNTTNLLWSTDSSGVLAPVGFTTSFTNDLFFSAGTNGTGGTVTVSGIQNARLITLEEGAVTFSGGTIALGSSGGFTVLAGAGNGIVSSNLTLGTINTFTVGTGRTLTLQTGVVSGASGAALIKSGAGQLTLSGANNYSGLTTVNQGTLAVANNSALGATTAGTVINNDGAALTGLLSLSGGITVSEPLSVFSPTNRTMITSTGGANTLSGPITQSGGGQTITVTSGSLNITGPVTGYSGTSAFVTTVSAGATLTLNSVNIAPIPGIGSVGNFYQNTGAGTVVLNGPTYFGNAIWQQRGGTLRGGAANVLQRNADLQLGAFFVTASATLDLGGFDQMVGQLSDGVGSGTSISNGGAGAAGNGTAVGTNHGVITNTGGAATLTLRNGTGTFSGPIQGSGVNAIGLTKAGTGVQTLAGVNTYTGATTVNAGSLTVDFGRFATGTTTALSNYLSSSSTLTLGGGVFTLQGHGDGSATTAGSWTRNANGADRTIVFGTLPTGLVVGQPVSGTGIPVGAFIVAIDTPNRLVKLSAAATAASGSDFASTATTFSSSQTVNGLTLNAGSSNLTVANTGSNTSTVLNLGAITRNAGGVVNFTIPTGTHSATNGITTATTNTNGLLGNGLGWATLGGTDFATNATNANGGNIIAYTGYTDVTRQSSGTKAIPNTGTANVRIIEGTGGSAANITLAATTTTINTLNQSASGGTGSATVDTANRTLRVHSILAGSGAGTLTIGTAANSGNLRSAGAELIINNFVGTTINAVIADGTGASALTKAGTGTLTLAADNTYTGATTVGGGTLALSGRLLGGGAVTVNGSGILTTTGTIAGASSLTIAAPGQASTLGGVNYYTGTTTVDSGSLTVLGAGALLGGGNITVTGDGTFAQNGGGIIGGATSITHASNSLTSNLSGTNTYTGSTTISSGQLQFGNRVSLYNASTASWTASNLVVASGATAAFNVGGAGQFTSGDLDVLKGLGTASGGFTNGSFLGLDTAGAPTTVFTYGGNIANPNGGTNVLGLTKLGANTLVLSGASTYTGRTLVNDGTLSVTGSLTGTDIVVNGGNIFQPATGVISGSSSFVHNSTATNTVLGGNNTYTGTTFVAGGTVIQTGLIANSSTVGVAGSGANFSQAASGVISGTTVFSMGSGTATLAGANTYTGETSIGGGTLTVSHAQALGATSGSTSVASGAYLRLAGGVTVTGESLFAAGDSNNLLSLQGNGGFTTWAGNVVSTGTTFLRLGATAGNALVITGNISNGGQVIVPQEAGRLVISGVISGSGGLTAATGSIGAYTLSGTNTYTGQTLINGSTATTIYTLADSGAVSSLGAPAAGAASLIQIGNGTSTGVLRYVGTGNSTNRPIQIGNNSGTPAVGDTGGSTILNDGTGAISFTNAAFNTPLAGTIANRSFTLRGFNTGLNTISGVIADNVASTGRVGVVKDGPGTWRLSGANTYTNGTTVNGGTLLWSGANNLPATGSLQVNAGGNFSLADGTARTTSTAALNLATGANLSFDWNAGSRDTLTSTAAATTAGNVGIIVNNTNPTGSGGNLITAPSGLDTANYFLANNTNFTATLTKASGSVSIGAQTSASALTDAYWVGGQVTGALGTMAFSSGTSSNWASDATGTSAGGVVPGGAAVNVIFGASGATQQANVTTGSDLNLGSLTFNDTTAVTIGGNNTISLNSTSSTPAISSGSGTAVTPGSAISVTSSASATNTITAGLLLAANQTWNVASSKTLVVSGAVSGPGGLTKADGGTLTLSGANSFIGGLTLSAGTLNINSTSALGADLSTFTINGGIIDNTTAGSITIGNNNNAITIDSDFTFSGTQNLNLGVGPVSLGTAPGTTRTITTTANTLTLGGNMVNGVTANALTKEGAGTLVLAGANAYTGPTTVNGGTLNLTGVMTGGTAITLNGSAVLTQSATGSIYGASSLTHSSNGTSILSGSNAYTGATSVTAGTLRLNNVGALGGSGGQTSIVNVSSGATLDLNGTNATANAGLTLNGAGVGGTAGALANSAGGTATYHGLVTLGSSSTITTTQNIILNNPGTITGPGFDLTLSGTAVTSSNVISSIGTGSGGLVKSGTGNWIISGANTYTGATTINAGNLRLGSAGALGTGAGSQTSGVTVVSGGGLDLYGSSPAANVPLTLNGTGVSAGGALLNSLPVRSTFTGLVSLGSSSSIAATGGDMILTNTGTITGTGTSDLTLNAGTGTYNRLSSAVGTGPGGLTKTGAGTWVLTGANTYTGITRIDGGTLVAGSLSNGGVPSNLGQSNSDAANLVLNGGRLQYNGDGNSTDRFFDLAASSTIASSGPGAVNFTNTGAYITSGPPSARTLTLTGYNTGSNTLAGVIANSGTSSNTTAITKSGSGSWTLSGTNSYTGTTTALGGNLILDYSAQSNTSDPLSAGAVLLDGGTVTLKGRTSSSTAETFSQLTLVNTQGVRSGLTLDNNGGSGVNLTITTLNGSSSTLTSGLIDVSGNAGGNPIAVTNIGTNIGSFGGSTTANVFGASGSRANIIVSDSSGYGFATLSGAAVGPGTSGANRTIGKLDLSTATELGGTNSDATVNFKRTAAGNLTRTSALDYQTLSIDSTAGDIVLAFGANSFAPSGNGRGVLVTGPNNVSITGTGALGTSQWFHNYGTGSFSISQPLGSGQNIYFSGSGFTNYSGTINPIFGTFGVNGGILRLSTDQTLPQTSNASNILSVSSGALLEIAADLNGSSPGDLNLAIGGANGNLRFFTDSGLSAFTATAGGSRVVNFGGGGGITWGANSFLTNVGGGDGNYKLLLSSTRANATIEIQNPIALNNFDRVIEVADGSALADARLSGPISGNGVGFTKTGLGNLELTAENTYTGPTTISGGSLRLGNGGATGSLSPSGTITNNGNFTINRNNTVAQGTDFSSAPISGSGSVTQAGSGTTTLSAANTYTGVTTVSAGRLIVTNAQALGTAAAGTNVASGASLELGSGLNYSTAEALEINGSGISNSGALRGGSGSTTYAGPITAATNATIHSGGGNLTLSGGIAKNGTVLTLTGGGTMNISGTISGALANSDLVVDSTAVTLSAANTYNGPTIIRNGGTVNANVTNALPTSPARSNLILDDTGSGASKLTLGTAQSVASLTGASTSTVELNANTLTIGTTAGTTTFAGVISGTGGLTKDGDSTQILSGSNTYDGLTVVNDGTLLVNGNQSGAEGNVTVNLNATLGGSGTIGGATEVNGTLTGGTDGRVELTGRVGNLTFENALTMGAGSTWLVDLIGGSGGQADFIHVIGALDAGLVTLVIAETGTWTYGEEFQIFQFGSMLHSFAGLSDGSMVSGSQGGQYRFNLVGDNGSLTAVPEPSTLIILPALLIGGITVARRRKGVVEKG